MAARIRSVLRIDLAHQSHAKIMDDFKEILVRVMSQVDGGFSRSLRVRNGEGKLTPRDIGQTQNGINFWGLPGLLEPKAPQTHAENG